MANFEGRASVETILRNWPAPIFAAGWICAEQGDTLYVHLAAASQRVRLRRDLSSALQAAGAARVRIRFHAAAQLHAPRSLERLVARFAGDDLVYDPTGAVGRARALVTAGQALRAGLSGKLAGLYYAPRLRTLFVTLNASSVATGEKVKIGALAEVERAVSAGMEAAFAHALEECPIVRVGFGMPSGIALVAVDARSLMPWRVRALRAVRRLWKPVTLAALFGFGIAGTAQAREPAVSQTNVKVTAQGGEVSGDGAWVFGGALTAPLGQYTGLQVEGGAVGVDDDSAWGGAAHLFTRDPDKYLLGLFAAYAQENDFDVDATIIGAEAEIYMNQITIMAKAGYQFSNLLNETPFGTIDLRWYATDNLAFTVGGAFTEDNSSASLNVEFMPGFSALPGLAFNVEGVVGDDDFDSVMGGITYYFGADASLKDRHRKQDPDSALFSLFQSIQAEKARLEALYSNLPPPPP